MKYITKLTAAIALLTPATVFAANPAAAAEACYMITSCCGLMCC